MKNIVVIASLSFIAACGGSTPPVGEAMPGAMPPGDTAPEGGPTGEAASSPACEELAKKCHEHAGASPLAKECHEIGHGGDAGACEAKHHECVAECEKAAASGEHAEHGHDDSGAPPHQH